MFKRVVAYTLACLALTHCGKGPFSGQGGSDAYPESCESILPADLAAEQETFHKDAEAQKAKILAEKTSVLKVKPIKASDLASIKLDPESGKYIQKDPFPNSVMTQLTKQDESQFKLLDKYFQFHGWEGAQTFYETEPGANKFFIVDEILIGTNDASLHSWHISDDNMLVRAVFKPTSTTIKSVKVCGCGPNASEMKNEEHHDHGNVLADSAGVSMPPEKAIFLLPGSKTPTLMETSMSIEYKQKQIDIKYVPRKGYACHQQQVAC